MATFDDALTIEQNGEGFKARFSLSQENLNVNTRASSSMCIVNKVFTQNQHGPHPNDFDRKGLVVEIDNNQQRISFIDMFRAYAPFPNKPPT